jgi:hypothetical protein
VWSDSDVDVVRRLAALEVLRSIAAGRMNADAAGRLVVSAGRPSTTCPPC